MARLTLALAAWISLVSVASASLTPRREFLVLGEEVSQVQAPKLLARATGRVAERGANSEFVLTSETEILLNGKPCRYEAVPKNASIVLMEVAEDKRTVLKIHFRTRK
jgi:hypothetical protein